MKLYQHKDDEGNAIYSNEQGEYVYNHHSEALNIYQNNMGRFEGGRQHDPIYNDENAEISNLHFWLIVGLMVGILNNNKPLLTYSEMKTQRFIITEQVEQV